MNEILDKRETKRTTVQFGDNQPDFYQQGHIVGFIEAF